MRLSEIQKQPSRFILLESLSQNIQLSNSFILTVSEAGLESESSNISTTVFPVDRRCRFNVYKTSIQRPTSYRRLIDVETTSSVYSDIDTPRNCQISKLEDKQVLSFFPNKSAFLIHTIFFWIFTRYWKQDEVIWKKCKRSLIISFRAFLLHIVH